MLTIFGAHPHRYCSKSNYQSESKMPPPAKSHICAISPKLFRDVHICHANFKERGLIIRQEPSSQTIIFTFDLSNVPPDTFLKPAEGGARAEEAL